MHKHRIGVIVSVKLEMFTSIGEFGPSSFSLVSIELYYQGHKYLCLSCGHESTREESICLMRVRILSSSRELYDPMLTDTIDTCSDTIDMLTDTIGMCSN